jgi:HSP20 family protein
MKDNCMALISWRNKNGELAPLADLRLEVDRLFDTFMRDPMGSLTDTLNNFRGWLPPVDVADNEGEIMVRAEIPGIEAKDLDISVSGNQLTIVGEKKDSSVSDGKSWHSTESRFGKFRRVIDLPVAVNADQVTADYSQGVLTIKLKKSQPDQGKRIEIKSF